MTVTIKQIAELAGVSRGTVDRALNGRDGVNVDVSVRIVKIAEMLGYKPNVAAKALAMKKYLNKKKIGVILNTSGNQFFDEVIAGINNYAVQIKDLGFEVVIHTINGFNVSDQISKIDELCDEGICGLAMTPINSSIIAKKIDELDQKGIPVVAVNTDIENSKRILYVGSDYHKGGRIAAGIFGLMAQGSQQYIGIITGSLQFMGHNLRISGMRDCIDREFPNIHIVDIAECKNNDITAYNAMKKMIENHPQITGVYFTAAGTKGGLQAIKELGLDHKLKIVTFDLVDDVRNNLLDGTISATICQDPFQQGFLSCKVLFESLMHGRTPDESAIITDTFVKLKYNLT